MRQGRQIRKIDGLFRLINRMSAEAASREELSNEIKSSGVDPERFVLSVKARLGEAMASTNNSMTTEAKRSTLPLISELKRLSRLSAMEIARRLEVPLAFLAALERNPDVIPSSWRDELATRAERALQISRDVVVAVLETPSRLEVATFNNRVSDKMLRYEDILEVSDMDELTKQFWLDLARVT
jgi:hypothetical protein